MNVRHIAKLAGVSPSAVSLALRGSPRISAATKARILGLADKLDYAPDARIVDLMRHLRRPREVRQQACFGVISFYESQCPWEKSRHLAGIYEGMQKRSRELGYRLEPLWLRAPGMTYRRFNSILETRGIDGLLCFGSPDFNQEFPAELGGHAVVTVGLSINTPLHRVTSHFYNDTLHALNHVQALGYRRPGLVLGMHEDTRSAYAHSSAYLGWCEHLFGDRAALPVLRMREVEETALHDWLDKNRPDVVIFVHLPEMVARFRAVLKRLKISVPGDVGVVVLSHEVRGSGFAGLQQNQRLMGSWAVELLAARIANRDLGIPVNPRTELVESEWIDGDSLRKRRIGQPLTRRRGGALPRIR